MKKIKVYGLKGCEKCDNLTKKLSDVGIPYEFTDCSGYLEECQDMEILTGALDYPIVVVNNVVIYQVLNYTKSAKMESLNSQYLGLGVLSMHELIGSTIAEYMKN
jgi:hypothetical protein